MNADRSSLALATIAVTLAVTLIVYAHDSRVEVPTNPPEKIEITVETVRVEWRDFPSKVPTVTPPPGYQTSIAITNMLVTASWTAINATAEVLKSTPMATP